MSKDMTSNMMIKKMIRRYKFIIIAFSIPLIEGVISHFIVVQDTPKYSWIVMLMSLFIIFIMSLKIVLLKKALK